MVRRRVKIIENQSFMKIKVKKIMGYFIELWSSLELNLMMPIKANLLIMIAKTV